MGINGGIFRRRKGAEVPGFTKRKFTQVRSLVWGLGFMNHEATIANLLSYTLSSQTKCPFFLFLRMQTRCQNIPSFVASMSPNRPVLRRDTHQTPTDQAFRSVLGTIEFGCLPSLGRAFQSFLPSALTLRTQTHRLRRIEMSTDPSGGRIRF